MFDLSSFIYDGIIDGIAQGQSRFVITERAAAWMARGVLTPEQMQAISDALDARDAPAEDVPTVFPLDEPTVIPEL